MNPELEVEHWIHKRGFTATRVCQTIVSNLARVHGVAPADDVAVCMSSLLKKDYNALDVRMMMGASESKEETAMLVHVSGLFKQFNRIEPEGSWSSLVDDGNDPAWVGYVGTFLRDSVRYSKEASDLIRLFRAAVAALPDVEGTDLTAAVAFPDLPGQPQEVSAFIAAAMTHFTVMPEVVLVPSPEDWIASEYIIIRTIEKDDGVVITVPTPKGVIVLNAAPI